jgi:hypothetical protein
VGEKQFLHAVLENLVHPRLVQFSSYTTIDATLAQPRSPVSNPGWDQQKTILAG